jgi:hypothetical protein
MSSSWTNFTELRKVSLAYMYRSPLRSAPSHNHDLLRVVAHLLVASFSIELAGVVHSARMFKYCSLVWYQAGTRILP